MLEVKDLHVSAGGREIVKGVSFSLGKGMTVLMGPNGAGKSTLARALMGDPEVQVSGKILLDGKDITGLPPEDRFKLGLFLGFQIPPEIKGVKVKMLLDWVARKLNTDLDYERLIQETGLTSDFLERDINVEFSGGERKKLELMQLLAFKPRYAVLDEPDSGVDVDSVIRIGRILEECKRECGILVVTHTTNLIKVSQPDRVMIMVDGKLVESGGPELVGCLENEGYARWLQ